MKEDRLFLSELFLVKTYTSEKFIIIPGYSALTVKAKSYSTSKAEESSSLSI